MKSLINYVIEQKNTKLQQKLYKYTPKTKKELYDLIRKRIKEEGNNVNLNDIDISEIDSISWLFENLKDFNGDISEWNVSNVKDMSYTFRMCENFNCNLSNWDVSNVTNLSGMFAFCESFEGIGLNKWDISNAKDTNNMFYDCKKFNTDISNWDVSNIINMNSMFKNCSIFNQNLEKWKNKINPNCKKWFIFNNCPKLSEQNKPSWYIQ